MGKNKAAKTVESNAREILSRTITSDDPTSRFKYHRNLTFGLPHPSYFNSKVLHTVRDEGSKRRQIYKDYCIEKIKAAFEGRKLAEETKQMAPLQQLRKNV